MKKILCIFILSLFFFSCISGVNDKEDDDQTNNNTKKELDQRLVGGRWYNVYNYMPLNKDESGGYYEFFPHQFFTAFSTLSEIHESSNFQRDVYSKDGIVIIVEHEIKLLKYEFTEAWPFPDTKTYELPPSLREQLDQIAAAGNIIKYSLYNTDGTLFDDGRYAQDWVLMRFE